jgi:hypothetical protein
MEHKNIIASGIVLVLIIGGMFMFAYLKKAEIENPTPPVVATETPKTPYDTIVRIDAKHFFIDGTHTLVGEIQMPTSCDLLQWDANVVAGETSSSMLATIDFRVINNTKDCPEAVTPQRFKVSFVAPSDAVMKATFMGRAVELNLIPAGEGETPDDFELFIKG